MLVELRLVEQRYQAVLEVLEGASGHRRGPPVWGGPPDGARVAGLRMPAMGWPGLADKSSRPLCVSASDGPGGGGRGSWRCAGEHPGWGPRTILYWLEHGGVRSVAGAHLGGAVR